LFDTDPRRLLGATIHAFDPFSAGDLLRNLQN
jgi:hypothetical protein